MESTLSMASARRRDLLRQSLRLRPTMAMEDTVGMALAMEAIAMGVLDTVMARGLLTLMLTTAMVGPTPATAMVVLDTAMVDTGTAKGLLTLRLMPTTAMEDMDLGMALAMEDTAMVVLATAMVDTGTAKGLLTLRLMPTTAMDLDMAL